MRIVKAGSVEKLSIDYLQVDVSPVVFIWHKYRIISPGS